jgi:7,8-dihydropterin-6-yl-methyl-4-(beta-D-ribofuranosyl)aminobenzene 5'-phosphate synthase
LIHSAKVPFFFWILLLLVVLSLPLFSANDAISKSLKRFIVMKIITLLENTRPDNSLLEARHGLSLYIEIENHKLLFDTGTDDSIIKNAAIMQVDLSSVEAVVLSHGHYDHAGGLRTFFQQNDHAPVYLLEGAQNKFYSLSRGLPYRYIGIDPSLFEEFGSRFRFFNHRLALFDHVQLYAVKDFGEFRPHNDVLFVDKNNERILDDFSHELVMSIEEKNANVVFTGCSHQGVVNMVRTVQEAQPALPIRCIIGGFHLSNTTTNRLTESEDVVIKLAERLKSIRIPKIVTGHCTGIAGMSALIPILGESLDALYSGKTIEV